MVIEAGLIDPLDEESACSLVLTGEQTQSPESEAPADQIPLAYEMLCQNLGHDIALDILRSFLSSIGELVTELQSAVRMQTCKEATSAIRELESASTVVGATGISSQAKLLEDSVRNGEWARAERQMAELVKETRDVGQFINKLLSQALRGRFSR